MFLGFFKDAVLTHMLFNTNNKLQRARKYMIMAYFKILLSHFPERSEETLSGLRIETGTTQIRSRIANQLSLNCLWMYECGLLGYLMTLSLE